MQLHLGNGYRFMSLLKTCYISMVILQIVDCKTKPPNLVSFQVWIFSWEDMTIKFDHFFSKL